MGGHFSYLNEKWPQMANVNNKEDSQFLVFWKKKKKLLQYIVAVPKNFAVLFQFSCVMSDVTMISSHLYTSKFSKTGKCIS